MRTSCSALFLVLAAIPLGASVVDVTANNSVLLRAGDRLSFEIDISSYRSLAWQYGAPFAPQEVQFLLASAPSGVDAQFDAWMESANGRVAPEFAGPTGFVDGIFQGSAYSGPISALSGSLDLTPLSSLRLFREGRAFVVLEDRNADVAIGLPPYSLASDMNVTVSGGPLSVGARVVSVTFQAGSEVPEPGAGWLMLGGAGLCFIAFLLRRTHVKTAQSTVERTPRGVVEALRSSSVIAP